MRKQIFAQLETSLGNLEEKKVGRADLAEVLFQLCLKVKGTEFVPDLKEVAENRIIADFVLPDKEEAQAN